MSSDQVRCDFCGTWIIPLDFIEGRAVIVLQKRYCPDCMTQAIVRSRMQQASDPAPAPGTEALLSPTPIPMPAARQTRRLKVGEHGCALYASEEERRAQLGPFIREGLESREKVLHILKMPTAEKILADFRSVGVRVQPYLQSGQLEILQAAKLLGKSGTFVPSEMAARLLHAAESALEEGYSRLRIAGEMTWALSSLIDTDQLVGYEQELSALAVGGKCTALCQYNIYRFETTSLRKVRRCHPFVFAKGTAETVLRELTPAV